MYLRLQSKQMLHKLARSLVLSTVHFGLWIDLSTLARLYQKHTGSCLSGSKIAFAKVYTAISARDLD